MPTETLEPPKTTTAPAAGLDLAARPTAGDDPANLTGQALRTALAHSARHRRGGVPVAPGKTEPNGHPKPVTAAAPAGEAGTGTDDTSAASTSTQQGEETSTEADAGDTLAALEAAADEPAAAAETETAPDPEETTDEPTKGVRDLQKRVGKLTARLKAYEAKFGALDGAAPQQEPSPAPAASAFPEHDHPEIAEIDAQIGAYEAHLQWLDANPDGGEYRDDQGRLLANITPERVGAMKRAAERKVTELTARRASRAERINEEHQQAVRDADRQAVERYPWLNSPETPEHQQASALLAEMPRSVVQALQSVPKARLYLGALVEGMKAQQARAQRTPPARPTPPKVMAPPSSAAPRSTPQDGLKTQLAEAEAAFEKSQSTNDYKRVLKLRRQMSANGRN